MLNKAQILITPPTPDYALIDSGDGEKLERYGKYTVYRPDPQALWPKLKPELWNLADAYFKRESLNSGWEMNSQLPLSWPITFSDLHFQIRLAAFKHTGIFPEQFPNWQWMQNLITKAKRPINVINLFGYTGGASLACAKAGASVCHVDGSKVAITWGRENAEISGLADKPIRWILDDCLVFLRREVKRGKTYDGIIMDPPAFGHGPKKELWKIEAHFLELLNLSFKVLSDHPLFFLINGYASGYSALAYQNNLLPLQKHFGGKLELGELAIVEEGSERLLPAGIFSRWQA